MKLKRHFCMMLLPIYLKYHHRIRWIVQNLICFLSKVSLVTNGFQKNYLTIISENSWKFSPINMLVVYDLMKQFCCNRHKAKSKPHQMLTSVWNHQVTTTAYQKHFMFSSHFILFMLHVFMKYYRRKQINCL